MRKWIVLIMVGFVLVGCSSQQGESTDTPTDQPQVVEGDRGGYSIITPYISSPLRQVYAQNYREVDTLEIGKGLQAMSKQYFLPKDNLISEGSIITVARYNELVNARSESNPYGLNPARNTQPFVENIKDSSGKITNSITIPNPRFVKSLYENDFYKDANRTTLSGVAISVVLNRHQVYDVENGYTQAISDESLFQIANDMIAVQLNAYLRTISEVREVPILIAFYVQDSTLDNLVGNYLPGTYIGHGLFNKSNGTTSLKKNNNRWYLLNSNAAASAISESYSDFSIFKNRVVGFLNDESIGVVGQAFTVNGTVEQISVDVNLGAKTQLEIYGLTQYLSTTIDTLSRVDIPIVIQVKMFQNARAIVIKNPGQSAQVQFLM